jgi:hypothetical protein
MQCHSVAVEINLVTVVPFAASIDDQELVLISKRKNWVMPHPFVIVHSLTAVAQESSAIG